MKAFKQLDQLANKLQPATANVVSAVSQALTGNWFAKVPGMDETNRTELDKLNGFLQTRKSLISGAVNKNIPAPGFILFFYGPSDTNKMQAIQSVANGNGQTIYNVDLTKIISTNNAETEKNLNQLISNAVSKNWILFFDEADALFGQRSNVNDGHDRYNNQETSYLLNQIKAASISAIFNCRLCKQADPVYKSYFTSAVYFAT